MSSSLSAARRGTAPRRARATAALLTATALLATLAGSASAHVSIPDGKTIVTGKSAIIHLRVPHGCEGKATTTVKVQLPEGVVGAKPELIGGWTVATEKVPAKYTLNGTDYTERVGVITWTGGPLGDDQFAEFGISATFLMTPGNYTMPVVQLCGANASVSWNEVKAPGATAEPAHPAPGFTVIAAAAAATTAPATQAPAAAATQAPAASPASTTESPSALTWVALALGALALVVSLAGSMRKRA